MKDQIATEPAIAQVKNVGVRGSERPLTSDYSNQMFAAAQAANLPERELRGLRNMLSTVDRTDSAPQAVASLLREYEQRFGL